MAEKSYKAILQLHVCITIIRNISSTVSKAWSSCDATAYWLLGYSGRASSHQWLVGGGGSRWLESCYSRDPATVFSAMGLRTSDATVQT